MQRSEASGPSLSCPFFSYLAASPTKKWSFSWRRIMASYAGHLSLSAVLGAAYGSAGAYYYQLDWGPAILGAGLTTIGGILPDLDSDSGVPVRELFGLGAVVIPFLVLRRLVNLQLTFEELIV